MKRVVTLAALALTSAALAEEGMWTLNDFPAARVKQKYGFAPDKQWLDHVRLSSVRLAGGCSASLVSARGLVMTNHHCAHSCIEQLSTPKRDLVSAGLHAREPKEEVRCPEVEVNQLVEITDVTARITAATKGLSGKAFNDAQKSEMSKVEKECATSDAVRCDVVTLYRGGKYDLYKYRRYQDVRLVFAPELAIAFFGGDPDNFMFPRWDLDVAFLRVYEGGKPLQAGHFFRFSEAGPKGEELVFVSGHPGGTSRLLTVAQLEFERDLRLPRALLWLAEMRGYLTQFQTKSAEHKRIANTWLFGVENSLKALKGRHRALLGRTLIEHRAAEEKSLEAKVQADPKLKEAYGDAWPTIAGALERHRPIYVRHQMLEGARAFLSEQAGVARTLVRAADELSKKNEERLREYADSKLPALKQGLFSPAPIYDELEAATLTFSLTKLREELGPDDPIVRKVLGDRSPAELARLLVKGTRLKEVKVRKALFDGGKKAIEASADPMIKLMREIDAEARAVRAKYEDEVEAPLKLGGEKLARAMFEVYGTSIYPDATFTLRLSYGQVKGWTEEGREVAPFTDFAGLFRRATGREPFALPRSWLSAKDRLNPESRLDFAASTDIIGGNSGSPVVNKDAEVVGLVFDGNIHSLGGDYGFDESLNRTVAVHSQAILEALEKVYGARRVLEELRPPAGPKAGAP
ncbi:MAG: S46 family peptidase [Myxococcales bacterium]|nr:S46 family peptidase [Myxococcales bacterium]